MQANLDIYVLRAFQWYKKLFDPMGFNPCNFSMKIRESIKTPIPKMGAHLGMWMFIPSHSPTLSGAWNVTPGLHSWPASFASPYFGREPKVRVTTNLLFSLCRFVWIIDSLVTHFNSHPRARAHPFTSQVLWTRERASILFPSIAFTFGLKVESIKEFGGALIWNKYWQEKNRNESWNEIFLYSLIWEVLHCNLVLYEIGGCDWSSSNANSRYIRGWLCFI